MKKLTLFLFAFFIIFSSLYAVGASSRPILDGNSAFSRPTMGVVDGSNRLVDPEDYSKAKEENNQKNENLKKMAKELVEKYNDTYKVINDKANLVYKWISNTIMAGILPIIVGLTLLIIFSNTKNLKEDIYNTTLRIVLFVLFIKYLIPFAHDILNGESGLFTLFTKYTLNDPDFHKEYLELSTDINAYVNTYGSTTTKISSIFFLPISAIFALINSLALELMSMALIVAEIFLFFIIRFCYMMSPITLTFSIFPFARNGWQTLMGYYICCSFNLFTLKVMKIFIIILLKVFLSMIISKNSFLSVGFQPIMTCIIIFGFILIVKIPSFTTKYIIMKGSAEAGQFGSSIVSGFAGSATKTLALAGMMASKGINLATLNIPGEVKKKLENASENIKKMGQIFAGSSDDTEKN